MSNEKRILRRWRRQRMRRPGATTLAASAALSVAMLGYGQITPGPRPLTTATQAVISYTAPDTNPCTVEVREEGATVLAHDVNPALFPGAHLDTRAGSAVEGRRRVLVIGKRAAEIALDGKRYSRALQTDTNHTFTVTCSGASTWNGTFRTTNIVLGNTYHEGVPADPNEPGVTAWPSLAWNDRTQSVVDPQTGLLIKRLSLSTDMFGTTLKSVSSAESASPEWTSPASVTADDSASATYSGTSRAYLFLNMPFTSGYGGSYAAPFSYLTQMQLTVNAWCDGGDCATASTDDRSLEFCLTNDRATCASQAISVVLQPCTSGCTGSTYRFVLGDDLNNQELLPAWFPGGAYANPPFNTPEVTQRTGTVNRDGNQVTRVSGNRFSMMWKPGMRITINSQSYTIASINSDKSLTLSNAPAGVENGVPYSATNFGVLVRKKTASATPVAIQFVRGFMITGDIPMAWDPSGSYENMTNCSHALTAGPSGEQGWHCQIAGGFYWIGKDSGTVHTLGRNFVEGRSGADGFPRFFCNGFWDKNDANLYYCVAPGSDTYEPVVIRMQYNGQNQPQGPSASAPLTECGSPPCWIVTNLTKASENRRLTQLISAFHPDFASYRTSVGFELLTMMGSSRRLLLRAYPVSVTNDLLGFYAIYNVETGAIDGAGPSWKYWPNRWSALHGYFDLGESNLVQWPVTTFRGPSTGYDPYPGNGPYYSRITSGAITTAGSACPARPAGSPIPVEEWPLGNYCMTITVDGEPGDPTPAMYTTGTITTSGSTVTGNGVNWNLHTNGRRMKIGQDYYTFTRLSSSSGTLSPAPPALTGSAYTLFLEDVDNPKTGPARREFAYLQDVEIRDIFCIGNNPTGYTYGICGAFGQTEYVRLLAKDGNTWTVERGYSRSGTRSPLLAANANAYITAMPPSCDYLVYPCSTTLSYWRIDDDPRAEGPGLFAVPATIANGTGHAFTRDSVELSAVAQTGCPLIDGNYYTCYNVRRGATDVLSTVTSSNNHLLSSQPAFAGVVGVGVPNIVDSHPSPAGRLTDSLNPGFMKWFIDARPMLGSGPTTASPQSPGVRVSGDLYKFTSSQVPYIRRKALPSFASCGMHPLTDASGPNRILSDGSADAYKYCIADKAGECASGSQAGEVFINCPKIQDLYCGTGSDLDARDVCIGGHSSYTSAIIQVGYERPNMSGSYGRPLTKGLSRYRLFDVFWNAKTTPDGKWLIFRALWTNLYDHQILLAKIPPFQPPDNVNRTSFVPLPVSIGAAPAGSQETHAVVEFGYNPSFHCTSRLEACVKGNDSSYAFAYETVAGVACSSGCRIEIPAIPQRVVYYRIVRRNAAGQRLWEGPTEILVSP